MTSKVEQLNDSNKSQNTTIIQLEKQFKQLTGKNNKLEKSLLEANTEVKTTNKIFENLQNQLRV
ncbi:MAG: hypothetical protein KZQ64_15470 [gamma proteobacterium symbiont of Bathyaustriella thionipta]|nr:hypothetical protein [gamma proteobacterium symbiont of Bathyaustriella thionipta]MCU7950618.1 hypothetical protein [gamma proteobacterium symbiont of Bathyaustriella thionipta]MCU7954768.1 hypothetical protein [gamma proteobacterium symbiont of Bathyaustriella thionipta]MCU7957127.1 hypothetical protein [gamma proteobacterium symbiont of Bathyaustriella thionipta]MCU7968958.1 hypothetical protein [gamma proteobacterium symbiont of Bathyaustriella thionipta]